VTVECGGRAAQGKVCDGVCQVRIAMIRLTLVHWLPLEQYPPACNMLRYFSAGGEYCVSCCTSIRADEQSAVSIPNVVLHRGSFPSGGGHVGTKLVELLALLWQILKGLFLSRPDVILYVEPHSALPVALYLLLRRSTRLFIHYHEYRELSHFQDRGNLVARLGRWCETAFLHRKAEWISHTNDDRLKMFLQDHAYVNPEVLHSLPNYPPDSWLPIISRSRIHCSESDSIRLVYVGALSLRDTFIQPLIEWIAAHRGGMRVRLDIYAGTMDAETRSFLESQHLSTVQVFFAGVPYERLPEILPQYDIGLILYRGNSLNYRYNAPNKLFEYLLCGLDVWYPGQMPGIRPIAASLSQQQVVEVNFDDHATMDRELDAGFVRKPREWFSTCEHVLASLGVSIQQGSGSGASQGVSGPPGNQCV